MIEAWTGREPRQLTFDSVPGTLGGGGALKAVRAPQRELGHHAHAGVDMRCTMCYNERYEQKKTPKANPSVPHVFPSRVRDTLHCGQRPAFPLRGIKGAFTGGPSVRAAKKAQALARKRMRHA